MQQTENQWYSPTPIAELADKNTSPEHKFRAKLLGTSQKDRDAELIVQLWRVANALEK